MKIKTFLTTLVLVLISDQWTKQIIVNKFRLGESIPVFAAFFNITYVRNTGAAFSLLHNSPPWFREPFFFIVPTVVLAVLIRYFYKLEPERKIAALAISMVISGALGNMIDRIRYGFVVDFLHFHWHHKIYWPMFNVSELLGDVGLVQ
jgi:signal peptidase II